MQRVKIKLVTRKPRRGRGKGKGSAFERWVCKKLSRWVSKGRRVDLFWRSSISGGRSSVARKKGVVVRQAGDICAVSPDGHSFTDHWYIECKAYRRIDIGQWLLNNEGKIATWWAKCRKEARQYGRNPMLIVKQNFWPVLVIVRVGHLAHFFKASEQYVEFRSFSRGCDVAFFDRLMTDGELL